MLVIANGPPPTDHPAEHSFDDPAARQDFEALLTVAATDDFERELKVGGLVHQFKPIVGAVGEKMFHPRPAFADRVEDRPRSGACRRRFSCPCHSRAFPRAAP